MQAMLFAVTLNMSGNTPVSLGNTVALDNHRTNRERRRGKEMGGREAENGEHSNGGMEGARGGSHGLVASLSQLLFLLTGFLSF